MILPSLGAPRQHCAEVEVDTSRENERSIICPLVPHPLCLWACSPAHSHHTIAMTRRPSTGTVANPYTCEAQIIQIPHTHQAQQHAVQNSTQSPTLQRQDELENCSVARHSVLEHTPHSRMTQSFSSSEEAAARSLSPLKREGGGIETHGMTSQSLPRHCQSFTQSSLHLIWLEL